MHCVGKKEIIDRCFPCRSRFIIRKTCLQGRFQPVSIRENKTSDIGSGAGELEAEFLSDPSETPEEFGQKIEDAYVKLLEENGK